MSGVEIGLCVQLTSGQVELAANLKLANILPYTLKCNARLTPSI